MPGAARGNSVDSVYSNTGTGRGCADPLVTSTNECSSDTFANGTGIVREDDKVTPHTPPGCNPPLDESPLTTFSSVVFINGKGAGRNGDQYTSDNTITSGSSTVIFG